MKQIFIKLFFVILISTHNIFALTEINDSALLGMLKVGSKIMVKTSASTIEGEEIGNINYGIGSSMAFGNEVATIRLHGSKSKKINLKAGNIFTITHIYSKESVCNDDNTACWFSIIADLESPKPQINAYRPTIFINVKDEYTPTNFAELRSVLNYDFEFYYAEGDDEEIDL